VAGEKGVRRKRIRARREQARSVGQEDGKVVVNEG